MTASFSYSIDGVYYIEAPEQFTATAGFWVGAKFGFFVIGEKGCMAVDWLRVSKGEK
jgi:hypothetical protein